MRRQVGRERDRELAAVRPHEGGVREVGIELGGRSLPRLRLARGRRLDRAAARRALARRLVVTAAAPSDEERCGEERCEPQVQPASERQTDVTSAMYVSVSSLGAPPAFATAVGPAL